MSSFVDERQAAGTYSFSLEDARALPGRSDKGLEVALARLKRVGRIVSPRRGFFVIVPIEYKSAGSPPASWYVDDLMCFLGQPYYVGLLSAAALHGAAHQQPMVFQVVTDRPTRPAECARIRIEFHVNRALGSLRLVDMQTETGTMKVSSPAVTAFDIVRYPAASGHLSNVATVLGELAEKLDPQALVDVAPAYALADVQRLGYLLDALGHGELTDSLARWLTQRRHRRVALVAGRSAAVSKRILAGKSLRTRRSRRTCDSAREHHRMASGCSVARRRSGRTGSRLVEGSCHDVRQSRRAGRARLPRWHSSAQTVLRATAPILRGHRPVQRTAEPIGPVMNAIRQTLDPWLGQPKWKQGQGRVAIIYRFDTTTLPVRSMRLKVEINTREHFAVLGLHPHRFAVDNPWFAGAAELIVFKLEELLATKLRALYQRKKGRDLFDLWTALSPDAPTIGIESLLDCFARYMEHGNTPVTRAQFELNLAGKMTDPSFVGDIEPLLPAAVQYDVNEAAKQVLSSLIAKLPGDPWKGSK